MPKTEQEHRSDIIEIGRLVFQKGWVAANDGNITVRLDEERILSTPAGVCKGMMRVEDLSVCDPDGRMISGMRGRTSEIDMHLTIYRMRPDVMGIVHAHPPFSTAFAVAGRPLDLALLPEVIVGLGIVPLARYGLPGTPELTADMRRYIPKHDALLMANHGAVAYGEDVWKAFFNLETVEHFAHITFVAEMLGGARALPRAEVLKLFAARDRYGVRSKTGMEPGSPVVAEEQPEPRRIETTREELTAIIDDILRSRGVLA